MKQCRYCGKDKDISEFNMSRLLKDGLRSYCRPCNAILARNYRATGSTIKNRYEMQTTEILIGFYNEIISVLNKRGYKIKTIKEKKDGAGNYK